MGLKLGILGMGQLKQPLLPRTSSQMPRTSSSDGSRRWQKCSFVSLTLLASALLATLVTLGMLNMLLVADNPHLSPLPPTSSSSMMQSPWNTDESFMKAAAGQPMLAVAAAAQAAPAWRAQQQQGPGGTTKFDHPFRNLQHLYSLQSSDSSPRCRSTGICDGDHTCGPDQLGCVTSAKQRQDHVRKAIAWSWQGYRKYAWGHDEVDVLTKAPHAWFNLGLTIVDSLDTLLIAGLQEEYQQARHWVANHLQFHDGSKVQFFEVNIRILGGLLSAYYLSGGDDVYLHKAQQLADRLMVAFNTSTGIPTTFVNLQDAAGRRKSGISDTKTNMAEAGTISMEFTTIGRLLGRDDMFDAGMHFWYVLMGSQNFSGLYCMGIHTKNGECSDPKITIGSAADSMYEYMLKQWLLSSGTQQVPLTLYKEAMKGVRKYLVRDVYDGVANMSFVSEAPANKATGAVAATNDRFEHLTCFAGGMFVLGNLHNISTNTTPDEHDDVTLGARIGRACYELYHQTPSGIAPDSVHYHNRATGAALPNSTPLEQPKKVTRRLRSSHRARLKQMKAQDSQKARKLHMHPWDALTNLIWPAMRMSSPGAAATSSPTAAQQQQQQQQEGSGGIRVPDIPSAGSSSSSSSTRRLMAAEAAASASSSPVPPPPPTPPPVVAAWSQLTHADFLRPEAVETLFYLWRATGDDIYREWGWNMFRAFERFCRLESGGYATVSDVNQVPPKLANKMESFWVAETLKYFYLLFEDDASVLPLDQWVFNTEAHPLPVWGTPADVQAMERAKQRHAAAMAGKERLKQEATAAPQEYDAVTRSAVARAQWLPKGKAQNADGYGLGGVQM